MHDGCGVVWWGLRRNHGKSQTQLINGCLCGGRSGGPQSVQMSGMPPLLRQAVGHKCSAAVDMTVRTSVSLPSLTPTRNMGATSSLPDGSFQPADLRTSISACPPMLQLAVGARCAAAVALTEATRVATPPATSGQLPAIRTPNQAHERDTDASPLFNPDGKIVGQAATPQPLRKYLAGAEYEHRKRLRAERRHARARAVKEGIAAHRKQNANGQAEE